MIPEFPEKFGHKFTLTYICNMKKEFIYYEQALALKELGFDEPVIAMYKEEFKKDLHTTMYWSKDNRNSMWIKGVISAPLYQQAFRWFREKHNLCGEVYTVNMGAIDYTFQIRDLYSEDIKHDNFEAYTGGYVGTFLNYEEAEQACLNKLIEICKTKINE